MDANTDLHEDAYDASDGEEAYIGMNVYVGDSADDEFWEGSISGEDRDGDFDDDAEEDEDEEEGDELDLEAEAAAIIGSDDNDESRSRFNSVLQDLMALEPDVDVEGAGSRSIALETILGLVRRNLAWSRLVPNATSRDEIEDELPGETGGLTNPKNRRKRAVQTWWKQPHKDPQPAGVRLLMSGEFGRIGRREYTQKDGSRNFSRILRERSMNCGQMPKQYLSEYMVPNSAGAEIALYPASVYCGQYSADSSFYYVCCKDFNLHIYDTTSPLHQDAQRTATHKTRMKVHKSIQGIPDGWTITDSHLSPDNERMIYSSMSPTVYMIKTLEDDSTQVPITFSEEGRRHSAWGWRDEAAIWSCRFSADGNEVIAGGQGEIFVYDLLANRRTVKISAHTDDVNSCCWADSGSNVLISASDDTFIKVWDRRSLGSSARPSGVLIGHTEGITNVSAKGDGRYVISNGKDQALRLWDLRKMASDADYRAVESKPYGLHGFDYRYADDRQQKRPAHPNDCSIMTYRGHTVLRTLIRCHFSPAETTGSRYIYSGSSDGKVHIWSLDGRLVQVLDRTNTLHMGFDPSGPEMPPIQRASGAACVRDVSWHSREPVMLSAAWGVHGTSSVARHEWKGLSKLNGSLEDWEEKRAAEARERTGLVYRVPLRRSARLAGLPGTYAIADDDDDDE